MLAAAESLADEWAPLDVTLLARRDNQAVVDDGKPRRKQERKAVPNVLAQERIVPRIELGALDALAVVASCPDVPFLDGDAHGASAGPGVILGDHDRPRLMRTGPVVAREPEAGDGIALEPVRQGHSESLPGWCGRVHRRLGNVRPPGRGRRGPVATGRQRGDTPENRYEENPATHRMPSGAELFIWAECFPPKWILAEKHGIVTAHSLPRPRR